MPGCPVWAVMFTTKLAGRRAPFPTCLDPCPDEETGLEVTAPLQGLGLTPQSKRGQPSPGAANALLLSGETLGKSVTRSLLFSSSQDTSPCPMEPGLAANISEH
ncbi:hypothetical protein Y1Q_0013806 [Alligator mississippiensis]|uniref:Uncharacterized protein n=1 Tax=Alligator mississippiensis TaxID=8496 RepID=A0A151NCE9_ALLMI|nr:hypothetical protein Y1Q_0013806 [Alligator mississippiensis]